MKSNCRKEQKIIKVIEIKDGVKENVKITFGGRGRENRRKPVERGEEDVQKTKLAELEKNPEAEKIENLREIGVEN